MRDEVGLEREYFLLDKRTGQIVEPQLYGFPFDEFGFLIEVRTKPHTTPRGLLRELRELENAHRLQAESLGLEIRMVHKMKLSKPFLIYLHRKHGYDSLPDLTANIHPGIFQSHATGIEEVWGTAGLHVHFSRKTEAGKRVQLPIFEMVKELDARFFDDIENSGRIPGEFEIKVHGFEYRSLPTNVDVTKAVNFCFGLFKKFPSKK